VSIAELPYEQAAGDGGPRPLTQMVVIHATDSTASDEAEASYATHRPDHTSAHFYTDSDSTIRALPLGDIAYGCYPTGNARSVQFELTGLSNAVSDATMREAAPVVAEVCRLYGIPIRKVGPGELVAGAKGIVGHADVTHAWGEGNHTDPGNLFDWGRFIAYVVAASGEPATSPPLPPSTVAPAWPGRYLRVQSPTINGPDVRTWQARMSVRGWRITVDGWYGPQSAGVCQAFQREKGLSVDGVVGPVTWRASWDAPIT
jgi:hypothetical protein